MAIGGVLGHGGGSVSTCVCVHPHTPVHTYTRRASRRERDIPALCLYPGLNGWAHYQHYINSPLYVLPRFRQEVHTLGGARGDKMSNVIVVLCAAANWVCAFVRVSLFGSNLRDDLKWSGVRRLWILSPDYLTGLYQCMWSESKMPLCLQKTMVWNLVAKCYKEI